MIKPIVKGEGPISAKIAIIGEAAGVNEAKYHRPFIGQAGDLLTKLMHNVGMARSDVYITNVIKQRPGADDNDMSTWMTIKGGKVWVSQDYEEYCLLLKEELLAMPNLTICIPLGNTALYALAGLVSIGKRRGSILESSLIPGVKCVPTIHPASALREFIQTYYIKHDLSRALEESKTKELSLPERTIYVEPTYNEVINYLTRCLHVEGIEIDIGNDIEVVNEEISCLSVSISPSECMSIPFYDNGQDYFTPDQELSIWLLLAKILEDPSIKKIGQNYIFDMSFIFRKYGITVRNFECTMIGQGITYPDFPKGLDFITSIYTREPYYKDEGKKYFKIGGSSRDFWKYNAKDSIVCQEAWPQIKDKLIRQGNYDAYETQRDLIHPLMYMQTRGMRVDFEGLKKASAEAEVKIATLTEELCTLCGCAINPNSPLQLKKYFYETKGLQPYYNRGAVTTNDDALKRLVRKGVKEAIVLRDIRKLSKLKGTYYDVTLSEDKRLRSAMNPVGTVSGRLSSSEDIFGEGTNVQNLPLVFQQYVLADDGYVMYICDLSQAENRTTANIAPEPLMIEAFAKELDIHSLTGSMISGIPADEIKQQDSEHVLCPLGTGEYTWRFWGKKCNHSLNYDLGYKNFALRFEMPETQAKILVERFHRIYPGIRQYHAWVRAQLTVDMTLTNCYGRKRTFLDRWGDELWKEAYSWIPQSSIASKINKQGMNFIYKNQQWFHPLELLNQVHDSLVFQIPLSIPFEQHADMLLRIKKSLETPVEWHGNSFVIPLEFKMCLVMAKGKTVRITNDETTEGLGNKLHGIYTELGAARQLPSVDEHLSDSSSFTEEM